MNVAIMTDENSGLSQSKAAEYGIHVLKMPVIIDGGVFFEGINLTHQSFYEALAAGRDVSTSMPSPGEVMDMWDDLLANGADQVVYIPMSSGLSSSCEAATSLAEDYDGKVEVVDNHRISVTLMQSVFDALNLAKQGKSAKEIKSTLEEKAYDASIYITVDTLKYLVKSGRVTAAGAALGAAFNIKPILTIQGEKLDAYAKVIGMHKSESKMIEAIKKDLDTRFGDVDKSKIKMWTATSCIDYDIAEKWTNVARGEFPEFEIVHNPLSLSIGSHVGPNSIALAIAQVID